jgi:hypothetical protein
MKKRQINSTITVIIIVLLVLIVLFAYFTSLNKPKVIVGNDRDSHGCIGSAGYSWCEAKGKCLRSWEENCTTVCDYTSATKTYLKKDTNCTINFACTKDSTAFRDDCGCGCELNVTEGQNNNNTNSSQRSDQLNSSDGRIYCTVEQKKPQVCPHYYSPTCGYFSKKIPCYTNRCYQFFSNSCFACLDSKIDSYIPGECP